MADNAELLQRIELLESLITADYTAPDGPEYSFPVTGQGVTSDQYRQMMLAMGTGVIHTGNYPYYLVKHDTDAETDSKNTLILKVDEVLGKGESIISGFFHRLTADTEVPIPPVTVATTYYVCLTFDPADEDDPSGPISLQVYSGPPPSTGGRDHIILATVARQPSQVLSQATITLHRPYVSPLISTQNVGQLDEIKTALYGTVAAVSLGGRGGIYSHVGDGDWRDILVGDWVNITTAAGFGVYTEYGPLQARRTILGTQLRGTIRRNTGGAIDADQVIGHLPAGHRPTQGEFRWAPRGSQQSGAPTLSFRTNGEIVVDSYSTTTFYNVSLDGIIIPTD